MELDAKTKSSTQIQGEMDTFCRNVKILREQYNLSKKEMAKIAGIGAASLAKIEQGIIPPRVSASIVIKLARHFGIKAHKLFAPASAKDKAG